jgi:UDP-GlcNAc:undecaprenyl-phosphate/decaprenyl-phosphate GlcNAc-1-phosphate transferase
LSHLYSFIILYLFILVKIFLTGLTIQRLNCLLYYNPRPISIEFLYFVIAIFAINLLSSYFLTGLVQRLSISLNIVDDPKSAPNRKHQKQPIPLLGGSPFVLTSMISMAILWVYNQYSFGNNLNSGLNLNSLFWLIISVSILLLAGFYDDKLHLSPKYMFAPIFLAILIAVTFGGLKIEILSYPFGSLIPNISWVHSLLAFAWIGFCLTATKFLDGLDGLVGTVGLIAFLNIASVSLFANVNQPLIFAFSMIWAAGLLGFLPYNFPNASLYLGEGASEIIGFIIGSLSIMSGAKVATSSTVIGWFIIDIILVMFARIIAGKGPFSGDRTHWHFRLIDLGLTKIQVLSLTTIIIIITSQLGLFFPTEQKVYVILAQIIFLTLIFGSSIFLTKKRTQLCQN